MLNPGRKFQNHSFRKNSSFLPNPAGPDARSTLPPTAQSKTIVNVDDFELKVSITIPIMAARYAVFSLPVPARWFSETPR